MPSNINADAPVNHKEKPSVEQVRKYLKKWDEALNFQGKLADEPQRNNLKKYVLQERILTKLFETYPENTEMDDVLIKVCILNDFYSTNILSTFVVAQHIVDLNIDRRLAARDLTLVNDIARVSVNSEKTINFYSFATKYCSHHFPCDYPIYDRFVEEMLMHFKRADTFYRFKKEDLKHYPKYYEILEKFIEYYGLGVFSLKEIDRYLWQAGKEYFPNRVRGKRADTE